MKVLNVKNEEGSVLLVTLVVLFVLCVVVVMGANNSLFEIKLAGNDKCLNDMKATAESAALAGLEAFKALSSEEMRTTLWNDTARQPWYHQGENNCVNDPSAFNGGDINQDGDVTDADGGDYDDRRGLRVARAYSQTFGRSSDTGDNWFLPDGSGVSGLAAGSCAQLVDTADKPIQFMENAQYMVIDTGSPPASMADSLGLSMDPGDSASWHQILITGVDEKCSGKYMVQIAYLVRF